MGIRSEIPGCNCLLYFPNLSIKLDFFVLVIFILLIIIIIEIIKVINELIFFKKFKLIKKPIKKNA